MGNCEATAKIRQPSAQRMTRRNNFGAVEGESQLVSRGCGGFCGAGLRKWLIFMESEERHLWRPTGFQKS